MKISLDKNAYVEAKQNKKSVTALIHEMSGAAGEVEPDYYLERAGKIRNKVQLSEKDHKLDAFEIQLMEHGLKMSGSEVSLAEDFYKTDDRKGLFPEWINRQVLIGMDLGRNACQLSDLIASTREIDASSYMSISATFTAGKRGAYRVAEGAEFPTIKIAEAEKPIKLEKFGHKVNLTYEVMRRMAINQLAVHMQKVGRRLRDDMVEWALYVLVNGDGNSNPAPVNSVTTLNYNNLIDFDLLWEDYEADVWVMAKAGVATLLKLTEFKDPQAGFNYQATGKLVSPIGVTLRKNATVAANTLIGVDKSTALEMVREAGSQLTEVDKIIDKQIESSVISQVAGFSKIYTNACRVWDYS